MGNGSTTSPWLRETSTAATRLMHVDTRFLSLLSRVAQLDEVEAEQKTLLETLKRTSQNGVRGDIQTILSYIKYRDHMLKVLAIGNDAHQQGKPAKTCRDELLAYLGPFSAEKATAFAVLFDMLARTPYKKDAWKTAVFPMLVAYAAAKQDPRSAGSYRQLRKIFKETFPEMGYRGSSERLPVQRPENLHPSPGVPPSQSKTDPKTTSLPPTIRLPNGGLGLITDDGRAGENEFGSEISW